MIKTKWKKADIENLIYDLYGKILNEKDIQKIIKLIKKVKKRDNVEYSFISDIIRSYLKIKNII